MASISIDASGLVEIEKAINAISEGIKTGRALLNVGAVVVSQTRHRIDSEKRDPWGKSWPQWSPEYAKTRHPNQSLLLSSGLLRDSITYQITRTHVRVGSNRFYSKWLQEGTSRMPERAFLGIGPDDAEEIEQVVIRNIRKLMRS